jgi:hypothetical protein
MIERVPAMGPDYDDIFGPTFSIETSNDRFSLGRTEYSNPRFPLTVQQALALNKTG